MKQTENACGWCAERQGSENGVEKKPKYSQSQHQVSSLHGQSGQESHMGTGEGGQCGLNSQESGL